MLSSMVKNQTKTSEVRTGRLYTQTERRQSSVFWITPPLGLLHKAETLQTHCATAHFEAWCLLWETLTLYTADTPLPDSRLSLSYQSTLLKTSLQKECFKNIIFPSVISIIHALGLSLWTIFLSLLPFRCINIWFQSPEDQPATEVAELQTFLPRQFCP